MPDHTVKKGECITSIADEHGFFWKTVWEDERNAALREMRQDPNTLLPGDVVYVPEKRPKHESRPTGETHRFRLKGIPALFRLQLFDNSHPRAGESYRLTVDGKVHEGVTSDDGLIEVPIPADARKATLLIGPDEERHEFLLGKLPPITEIEGLQARLENLGFDCGGSSGELDVATREAIRAFQDRVGLEVTGVPDVATRDELRKWHDELDRPGWSEEAWAGLGESPAMSGKNDVWRS